MIALVFSSSTDLLMQSATMRRPIWQYVSASNAVSLLVDSIVFATIAFAAVPFSVRLQIIAGQYLAKLAMTAISIPLMYWTRWWSRPDEDGNVLPSGRPIEV